MKVEVKRIVPGTMVEKYLTAIEELCRVNVVADDNGIRFDVDDCHYSVKYDVKLTMSVEKRKKI